MSKDEMQRHILKEWTDDIEILLKNISEKCQIWRELHMKTHSIFKKKYYRLTIPVIVLSSITGGANLSLGSISTSADNNIINLVIGAIGIIISILSTLNNIFSFSKRKDEHYRASNDWYRLHRLIKTELSLERDRRIEATKFFNMVLHEIERIHDYQPNIRNDVLSDFKKSLRKKGKTFSIEMPEIINLSETLIYKKTSDPSNEIRKMSTIIDIPESSEEISSLSSSNLDNETPIVTAVNSVDASPVIQKHIIRPSGGHFKKDKLKEQIQFNIQNIQNVQKDAIIDIKPKILNEIIEEKKEMTKFIDVKENDGNKDDSDTDNEDIESKTYKEKIGKDDDENQLETEKQDNFQQWNSTSTSNLGNLLNRVISNVSYNKKNQV